MANPVWGLLLKSLVSNETIEQAIERLITAHNDDEEAHTGVGQSLQSHKASEIIDHLAVSIINDKLADKSVTPSKTLEDRIYHKYSFDSVDNWVITKSVDYSAFLPVFNSLWINPGYTAVSYAYGHQTCLPGGVSLPKNPYFQCTIFVTPTQDQIDFHILLGTQYPSISGFQNFGFFFNHSDQHLYAHSKGDNAVADYDLGVVASVTNIILRVEYDNATDTLTFYINGEVVHTRNPGLQDSYLVYGLLIGASSFGVSTNKYLGIKSLIFSSDL